MPNYEQEVLREALRWEKKIQRNSSLIQKTSKKIQTKINQKIPDQVHDVITESIRKMIELSLTGSSYIYPLHVDPEWDLKRREEEITRRKIQYRRTAAIEGAGTGAGGILLGMADFPMLLSIKMKFLFDTARIYGYDVDQYEEKMYLLHVFMLAFSSDEKRKHVFKTLRNWEKEVTVWKDVDWKTLQLEYRDTIDLIKMLQLIPGFGAVVGAWANSKLLNELAETAMNMYRLRLFDP
ncbi:EcsC family protein [Melghiribacillus thermohalophilus]|uniref:EcsC family protein n=1 Tax=Melghiribacillus thermohalophilus TaxID=1324956 RepID=A0A4R3N3Y7_9BACI|nr:EcsC family protein [Melghiribacillus thermohalophilus]TCT23675.1 EcsC family protein [Melghiribacillus thermohalophilus]